MKRLLLFGILLCLLSSLVAADCTTIGDMKYCTGTVDLDTETFTDTGVIIIFHNVDFTKTATEPNASFPYDGNSITVSITAASLIFEDTTLDFSGTDATTPSAETTGGKGGDVILNLAVLGTIGFYNTNFTLTAGNGAEGGTGPTTWPWNYGADGGAGGNAIISITATTVYLNDSSNFNFLAGDGGDGQASRDNYGDVEGAGGAAGLVNFTISEELVSDGQIDLTAGDGGTPDVDVEGGAGYGNSADSPGIAGGSINFIGETISLADFNFLSGTGSKADALAEGDDENGDDPGGDSGTILINASDTLSFTGEGNFSFGRAGDADSSCSGTAGGGKPGGKSNGLFLYFNHSILTNADLYFNGGDGGDGSACGDETGDGGSASNLLISGTDMKLSNSNFTATAGNPGVEDGSEGDDGGMSDFKFQSSMFINNSNIKTIQDTTIYYCNAGGVLWIIGDYFNISSSTVVMNASTSGGGDEGTVTNCNSGVGGDLIIRTTTGNFEDGSLTLTSGPGGRGVGGAVDDANSGPLTFNISDFTMDNFTLALGTGDVTVVQGGSDVGDMKVYFDNITWSDSTFNWDEGDPTTAATNSNVNITEIAIVSGSLINFTTNPATSSKNVSWYFKGWQTKIEDSTLTNTSDTDLEYTIKADGWDFQDNHTYVWVTNTTCPQMQVECVVGLTLHNHTADIGSCDLVWNAPSYNITATTDSYPVPTASPAGPADYDMDFTVKQKSIISNLYGAGSHSTCSDIVITVYRGACGTGTALASKTASGYGLNYYTSFNLSEYSQVLLPDVAYCLRTISGGVCYPYYKTASYDGTILTFVTQKAMFQSGGSGSLVATAVDAVGIESESEPKWNTRIFNVTPRGNRSLDWPNDGWNCYTDFEVYNSSVVNSTTNNFAGTHSVGDDIWCELNLTYAGEPFTITQNKSTTAVAPYPYDLKLYIGNQEAYTNSSEFDGSITTHFRAGVNYWEQYECTDSTCLIPINFTSNSSEALLNLSSLFVEWGQSPASHGDYQVPIVITSNSSGMFNISNWYFEYYNDTEIEMNVTTNTSITRIINITHSKINLSQAYDYIEFFPTTLSSKNVTPYGQNSTTPFFNITYDANRDFEIAILLNQTMPTCMNISASKDNNSQYYVLTTSAYALTNLTENESLSVWLDLDMEDCDRTALHALYTLDAYFDTCCDGCVPCFD